MIWRVVLAVCSLTFVVGGCDVWFSEDCQYVKIGDDNSGRRSVGYTCFPRDGDGRMSAGAGGAILFAIGAGMLGIACWPLLRTAGDNHRRNSNYTNTDRHTKINSDRNTYTFSSRDSNKRRPPPPPPPQGDYDQSKSRSYASTTTKREAALSVLGLDATATLGDITNAYRGLVRKHHPDLVDGAMQDAATRKTAEINVAYDYLTNSNNIESSAEEYMQRLFASASGEEMPQTYKDSLARYVHIVKNQELYGSTSNAKARQAEAARATQLAAVIAMTTDQESPVTRRWEWVFLWLTAWNYTEEGDSTYAARQICDAIEHATGYLPDPFNIGIEASVLAAAGGAWDGMNERIRQTASGLNDDQVAQMQRAAVQEWIEEASVAWGRYAATKGAVLDTHRQLFPSF